MKLAAVITLLFLPCLAIASTADVFSKKSVFSKLALNHTDSSTSDSQSEGYYALVAGGSKGIGFAIAEALAKRNYNLILIARNQDALENARLYLVNKYQIKVSILAIDLSTETSAGEIENFCISNHIRLKVLCNVAGFGGTNDYLSFPVDSLRYMIRLNLESPAVLTMKLLPLLEINAPSYILNVGSMAGFTPIPSKNLYASTKAALISFSHSLRYQLADKNISVSCLTPGPVFTKEEIIADTREKLGWIGMKMAVPTKDVGEIAVKKMLKGKIIIIPGSLATVSSWLVRLLPDQVAASLFYRIEKNRSYKNN